MVHPSREGENAGVLEDVDAGNDSPPSTEQQFSRRNRSQVVSDNSMAAAKMRGGRVHHSVDLGQIPAEKLAG
jgi:hypothetical protein